MADFIDANIFIRHLTQDQPTHSPRATAYLQQIELGQIRGYTVDVVIFEVVFTLERFYRKAKQDIQRSFLPLIELPGISIPGKRGFRQVFDVYVTRDVPFADAYIAVEMQRRGLSRIASFDADFDRVPGITRVEP
jgi:uncharacterized protein